MNDEARDKANRELERAAWRRAVEIGVSRTYIEWLLDLPWGKTTPDNPDLKRARGFWRRITTGWMKQRVIEYLAVCRIKKQHEGGRCSASSARRAWAIRQEHPAPRTQAQVCSDVSGRRARRGGNCGHRRTYIGAIPGADHFGPSSRRGR